MSDPLFSTCYFTKKNKKNMVNEHYNYMKQKQKVYSVFCYVSRSKIIQNIMIKYLHSFISYLLCLRKILRATNLHFILFTNRTQKQAH